MPRRSNPPTRPPEGSARKAGFVLSLPSPIALLKALFVRPVKLRRVGKQIHFVLDGKPPGEPPDPVSAQMHAELKALFDVAPASRKVLRTLATIEHHLAKRGSAFIPELSLAVLQQATRQLDGLAPRRGAGIALLRSRFADAIAAHERRQIEHDLLRPATLLGDHNLQVREGSVSDFRTDLKSDFPSDFERPPAR